MKQDSFELLTKTRKIFSPGLVCRHYESGKLYRVLGLSRKEDNPKLGESSVQVMYAELVPMKSPLFTPLTLVKMWDLDCLHRPAHEFFATVETAEGRPMRYQALAYKPEEGWSLAVGGYLSEPLALDGAFDRLRYWMEADAIKPDLGSFTFDSVKIPAWYTSALFYGVVELTTEADKAEIKIAIGRHDFLQNALKEGAA